MTFGGEILQHKTIMQDASSMRISRISGILKETFFPSIIQEGARSLKEPKSTIAAMKKQKIMTESFAPFVIFLSLNLPGSTF